MNLKIIVIIVLLICGLFVFQQYQKKTQAISQDVPATHETNTVPPTAPKQIDSPDHQTQTQNDFSQNDADSSQRQQAESNPTQLRKNEQDLRNVREEAIRKSPPP